MVGPSQASLVRVQEAWLTVPGWCAPCSQHCRKLCAAYGVATVVCYGLLLWSLLMLLMLLLLLLWLFFICWWCCCWFCWFDVDVVFVDLFLLLLFIDVALVGLLVLLCLLLLMLVFLICCYHYCCYWCCSCRFVDLLFSCSYWFVFVVCVVVDYVFVDIGNILLLHHVSNVMQQSHCWITPEVCLEYGAACCYCNLSRVVTSPTIKNNDHWKIQKDPETI